MFRKKKKLKNLGEGEKEREMGEWVGDWYATLLL